MSSPLRAAERPAAGLSRAWSLDGSLAADPAQAHAVERLQDLWERLRGYDPTAVTAAESGGLLSRMLRRRHAEEYVPTGLYLVGEVGRGKSMLMDLFFETADVPRKQRIHFHRFMQSVARPHPRLEEGQSGRAPIRFRRWPIRSPPMRRCCASTSSRSTTSPTR